ncbi:MAG: signal peptidase I [Clostridiales bacterium]|jgi:signal peptidase|nr:signal peptidase I [Clostridiales bacterium]
MTEKKELNGDSDGKTSKKKLFYREIISDIVFLILLFTFLGAAFLSVTTRDENSRGSSLGAYRILVVLTGSMSPVINPNDIIVVKNVPFEDITVDDILTFNLSHGETARLVTHRAISVDAENRRFITKGDANGVADNTPVDFDRVVGEVVLVIPRIGAVTRFLSAPSGMISIVIFYAAAVVMSKIFKSNAK